MDSENTQNGEVAFKRFLKSIWGYIKIAKVELIVMIALFAIDLISKAVINATLDEYQTVTLIPYFLNFRNVHNKNAAFGSDWMRNLFGDKGAQVVFCLLAFVATAAFIFFMVRNRKGSKLFRIALGMLAAGAMGNCIDRMCLEYVRDFIEIVYFGLTIFGKTSFYIFNIADASLVIGVIMVIVYFLFFFRDKDDHKTVVSSVTTEAGSRPAGKADGTADESKDGDTSVPDAAPEPPEDSVPQEQAEPPEDSVPQEQAEQPKDSATAEQTAETPDEAADGGETP